MNEKRMSRVQMCLILVVIGAGLPGAGGLQAQFPPESRWQPAAPLELPRPGYLETVHDPLSGVDITCISDPEVFGVPEGAGALQHQYSKIQAWNADMSKILIGYTHVLNAEDYTLWKDFASAYRDGYYEDGRWSHLDPDIRYFCWKEAFLRIDIRSEEVDTLHVFPGYHVTIGPWEGNISADDHYAVITNTRGNYGDKAALYDMRLDSVVATRDFPGAGFDWATITPWNDYVVVSNNETGHTELYDLHFDYLRDLTDGQEHADFALDTQGNEVFVQVIPLQMTRLRDGVVTDLITDATLCGWSHENPRIAGHISGRNLRLPGWALVSTHINVCGNGKGYFYATEIFAVRLDGSGVIRPYGHSRSSWESYASATVATFSPDGTRVIFKSDWGFAGDPAPVRTYVAEYRDPATSVARDLDAAVPLQPALDPVWPNPFNSSTAIRYRLAASGPVRLAVYALTGQRIRVLVATVQSPGDHQVAWDGKTDAGVAVSSGVYIVRLEAAGGYRQDKLALIK